MASRIIAPGLRDDPFSAITDIANQASDYYNRAQSVYNTVTGQTPDQSQPAPQQYSADAAAPPTTQGRIQVGYDSGATDDAPKSDTTKYLMWGGGALLLLFLLTK
jgi:hypothetical protein